ncbi:hypothetical protein [Sphingobacterium pedocola]|uniref:Carboxypeptidase regulatory-like domain-containing protein n=1 Tax=Sphingobacterium pedocola TaxID=2082722 RepID=A0ABR9TBX1_9SPHI|nr:hypothetical protein [Sphingobacterium pedocola]MBE8722863.1 hypothetical protein [Sphingobacterium pedocola]
MQKIIWNCIFSMLFTHLVSAQEIDTATVLVDEIQVDVKNVALSIKGDTATVDLFLISYQRNPRELKLNTYATQITDSKGDFHLYDSMKMGRVLILLAHRQNYLHYFMEEDVPVPFQIKVANWTRDKGKPTHVKLVFEDSKEEGRYLERIVEL